MKLDNLLIQFLRDNEIRDSSSVFIARGEASKVLDSAEDNNTPAEYMIEITDNRGKVAKLLPLMTLQKVNSNMAAGKSFLLQCIFAEKKNVKMVGAGIINGKTKKLSGFLNEEEVDGLTWLTGDGLGGIVKSFGKENRLINFEVDTMIGKITPYLQGDHVSFDVEVTSVGHLSEDWFEEENAFSNDFLKQAEQSTEKEIKRMVDRTLLAMQKTYKVDVANFGEQVRIQHPKAWGKMKDNWDEVFSQSTVHYRVKVTINDYGLQGTKMQRK
ncbi:Ger(x)C family spore germination protein [Brevibacillus nitrificans]|uniref:Ger(x)C family spore germination protein n=1 Tax=Brevibacillus nitrificans TaxID=651560 RepID=UPI0028558B33|nr:Ger(x)C family spore germination protein [Brevibacillus nitrificans]MDR7316830.1 Ger(x)C family germination protein [Brevibacillus nitrificans]